jgi:hypothetical protein
MEFLKDLIGPVAGAVLLAVFSAIWVKLQARIKQPQQVATDLASFKEDIKQNNDMLSKKIDNLSEAYAIGVKNSKEAQVVLFTVQDYQFGVLDKQNDALRELAKSVCNGNKADALQMLDDASTLSELGRNAQRDYLVKRG